MAPPARRPLIRLQGAPRRLTGVAVVLTLVLLGGAVAAFYGTGVVLGSRLSPPTDGEAAEVGSAQAAGSGVQPIDGSAPGPGPDDGSALTDRVERRTSPRGTEATDPAPSTPGGTAPGPGGGTASVGSSDQARGTYPGVWPYADWAGLRDHVARGDVAFTTPEDTALRFAREVAGMLEPRLGAQRVTREDAVIEIRTAKGATEVALVRPDLDGAPDVPWGVVGAAGDLDLAVDTVAPGRVDVRVGGAAPAVVALNDRAGWRGVARTVDGGRAALAVTAGATAPAAAVALSGDPRDPSAFAVARVALGAGVAAPAPPTDPRQAVDALATAVAAGDVSTVWAGLDDGVRRSVLDWRGLAARWADLDGRLAPLRGAGVAVATVATPDGPVQVVASNDPGEVGASAPVVAFRARDGRPALASLDLPGVEWTAAAAAPGTLTARGDRRPVAVVLDGVALAATPSGDRGLDVSLVGVAPGRHVAVAVFPGEVVGVAATVISTAEVEVTPPTTTPPTTVPPTTVPPGSSTTGPPRSTGSAPAPPAPTPGGAPR